MSPSTPFVTVQALLGAVPTTRLLPRSVSVAAPHVAALFPWLSSTVPPIETVEASSARRASDLRK